MVLAARERFEIFPVRVQVILHFTLAIRAVLKATKRPDRDRFLCRFVDVP
jgi:hypothetical protein